jgi:6-phosphofructokinase 1
MIRLRRDDFNDPHELAKFAATAGLSLQEFRKEFEYLVNDEPPPVVFDPELGFVEQGEDHTTPDSPVHREKSAAAEQKG